ncbi:hypothetical protein SAMN02910414_00252 [Lachnobacterium bovis DSM 14045]|uniref:Uncharacterized protein n=1 Tax=Lachnobacterium bovis DSM 14045 TaxID=1122142 RepID=A0A1H3FJ39_9FIRM|nr:hypothetical protein SAMN02910414_00252 [Lachnobacterium bovis DSM 14045]
MYDNPVYLEPTFTLNGTPKSLIRCQASDLDSGRQKISCGNPPSIG